MTPRILACDDVSSVGLDLLRSEGFEVVSRPGVDPADLLTIIPEFDALLVRSRTKVDASIIEAGASRLRLIGRAGFGLDRIDVSAATKAGVAVMQSPAGIAITAAEFTLGLLLSVARNIPRAHEAMRSGRWDKRRNRGVQLFGKTLGILGMGNVGRAVAERAVLLGMDVIVHDPMVDDALVVAVGARPVSWSDLLASSHFISVHVAGSERTRGLLDDAAFGQMKEGVRLVNCSRGAVVNEEALLQALRTGKVAAAAMDVFESEPPFGSPLLEMPQFTATPHLVSSTFEAQIAVAKELAEQVRDFFVSGEVRGIVNPEVLEGPATESKS